MQPSKIPQIPITGRAPFLTASKLIVAGLILAGTLLRAGPCRAELSPQQAEQKSPNVATKQLFEPLRKQLEEALDRAKVPAAALVLVDTQHKSREKRLIHSFGSATETTPFRLGSISKTFTALALLHAAAATATPLSSAAAPIIGERYWSNPYKSKNPVSLAQLVELSAGFSDISAAEFASAVPIERKQALSIHSATHVTHWPPGAFHSYSNLAPAFTALAIEALTHQRFDDYLHHNVLKPLGLPGASLAPLPNLPGGYKADGATPIPYWHTIYPAFGGLNATPAEFANFLSRLVSDNLGESLSAARDHRGGVPLYQPLTTAAARAGLTRGYGTGIYGWERHGHRFAGHGGDADGYRSRYAIMPDAKRGYFLAINTDNPGLLRALTKKVERYLTQDLPKPRQSAVILDRQTLGAIAAHAQAFAGKYVRASVRFDPGALSRCEQKQPRLSINITDVLWQRGERKQRLKATSKGLYRKPNNTLASVALVYINGKRHLHEDGANWVHVEDASRCSH